ncbi:helix-hairpin-helix domain-containing protein [Bdellovibrio sp. HCB337]|uniref:helix-hairpin-helix domain-containing protein n=1 Tax=Bdellovibrio sp. HCB337 TaxID=3394358 RepID=UPI0039A4C164
MDQALQSYLSRIIPTVPAKSAAAVIELAAEGGTVPFIARYRKEKTGNLDEVQIRAVLEGHETYNEIVKRKAFLIKEIGEQNNLTAEVKKRIDLSWDLGELEEIYKPFKKKKKTKATIAREAGLEPLANWIWDMGHGLLKDSETMEMKAKNFLNPTAKIVTYEEALKGAQDIIVDKIANDADLRSIVNKNYMEKGRVIAKAAKGYKPHSKFEMYKEFEEPVKSLLETKSSHRYMAMRRGWQEEELSVDVKGDEEDLLRTFTSYATKNPDNAIGDYLAQCARLALNVYVVPSVVNEVHRMLKEKGDEEAIKVFAENVRKLLLASPYGPKCILGVDPGLRTGCKVALIDKGGNFISHTVLYTLGDNAEEKAKVLFKEVLKQIQIEAIAVGNGTAGRETEVFLRKILKDLKSNIPVVMVNESGASVYSASDVARQEFPDLDITVKGAISIARRLQDPLAELVKIDPKSIGVGQYQHDVNQPSLKKSLEAVVESCVNNVGVDLNTASTALLSFVSGIGPALANNIVEHRKTKGLFTERSELLKVPKFSTKVYEQAAGFLRIHGGKVVLDNTGIHPERYTAVRDMVQELGCAIPDVVGDGAKKLLALRTKWAALIGDFTFDDIVKELEKPGRDPRDPFKVFQFRDDIFEVKDLKEQMICPGIVTNVTNFGAFVDIGVHQDGLVHISALSNKFVEDPRKVVNPGDQVTVKVLKVDMEKNQISLTMKLDDAPEHKAPRDMKSAQGGGPRAGGPGGGRPQHGGGPRRDQGHRQDRGGDRDQRGGGKPAGNPFNNPFAALLNINDKK